MIEGFQAVEWMRRRRAELDDEERALTWQERSRRTQEALESDPLWERLKGRVITAVPLGLVGPPEGRYPPT